MGQSDGAGGLLPGSGTTPWGDYRILAGSSAVDAGYYVADLSDSLAHDYFNVVRPQGVAYDIGANEIVANPAPGMPVAPALVDFGLVPANVQAVRNITVENSGSAPLTISPIAQPVGAAPNYFTVTAETCTATPLPRAGKCTITVAFAPTTVTAPNAPAFAATLTVVGNGVSTPAVIQLQGKGAPFVNLNPSNLVFGPQQTGTASAAQTVNITAPFGGATISSIQIVNVRGSNGAQNYSQTNNCGALPVVAGVNFACTVNVVFKPVRTGSLTAPRVADLRVRTTMGTFNVSLSGNATAPSGTVAPATVVNFGNQARGTATPAANQAVETITNTGAGPLVVTATLTGTGAAQFRITNNTCPTAGVAVGGNCTVTLAFSPTAGTARGAKAAALRVTFPAPATPVPAASIALTGTAQ